MIRLLTSTNRSKKLINNVTYKVKHDYRKLNNKNRCLPSKSAGQNHEAQPH